MVDAIMEALAPLCSKDPLRSAWMRKPWSLSRNGVAYVGATDGHGATLLVGLTSAPDIDLSPASTLLTRIETPTAVDLAHLRAWLVAMPPQTAECDCDLARLAKCPADDCRRGVVNRHECDCEFCCAPRGDDCRTCKGKGRVPCTKCDAQRRTPRQPLAGIAGRVFDRDLLLRYLAPLTGRATMSGSTRHAEALAVEAENGFSRVMPRCEWDRADAFYVPGVGHGE